MYYIILVLNTGEDMQIEKIIKWSGNEITKYLGRNGTGKCIGVNIYDYTPMNSKVEEHCNTIEISPINSKGDVARCSMIIPLEAIPELTAHLQGIYMQAIIDKKI